MALTLTSTSFLHQGMIPARHTCEGADLSPPLSWVGVPDNTQSLVLIVDDPDAPDPQAPTMTWVHWLLYNLPPQATGLTEGLVPKICRRARCRGSMIGIARAMADPVRQWVGIGTFTNCSHWISDCLT